MTVFKHLYNSVLTQAATNILRPFVVSKSNEWYNICGGFNTGCDVEADDVYAIASGAVVFIGQGDGLYNVVVQHDDKYAINYANLKSTKLKKNDVVLPGAAIGNAKKFVRVEKLTTDEVNLEWPFRFGMVTYFREDPLDLITGSESWVETLAPTNDYDHTELPITLGSAMDVELSEGRGNRYEGYAKMEPWFTDHLSVDTDGATPGGKKKYGKYHQTRTAYYDQWLDAEKHYYTVRPADYSGSAKLGDLSVVLDQSTGKYVWAVIGDSGNRGDPREVSIKVCWDLGYDTNGNWAPQGNFEIIFFPGTKQTWPKNANFNKALAEAGSKIWPTSSSPIIPILIS